MGHHEILIEQKKKVAELAKAKEAPRPTVKRKHKQETK